MNKFGKGMAAGLVATIVLSALMVMKTLMGIMPGLELPKMIAGMMGMPDQPLVGWAVHFMIGDRLPGGSRVGHGILLAVGGWLLRMIVLMPMAGAGLFGIKIRSTTTRPAASLRGLDAA
ncbi:MAG: hypothetical protein M3150_03870 [Pseudomonadota bacterium]|nr:hypothetical protein [Pseudomonadota bacterium]